MDLFMRRNGMQFKVMEENNKGSSDKTNRAFTVISCMNIEMLCFVPLFKLKYT